MTHRIGSVICEMNSPDGCMVVATARRTRHPGEARLARISHRPGCSKRVRQASHDRAVAVCLLTARFEPLMADSATTSSGCGERCNRGWRYRYGIGTACPKPVASPKSLTSIGPRAPIGPPSPADADGEAFEVMIEAYWIKGKVSVSTLGFGMSGLTGHHSIRGCS